MPCRVTRSMRSSTRLSLHQPPYPLHRPPPAAGSRKSGGCPVRATSARPLLGHFRVHLEPRGIPRSGCPGPGCPSHQPSMPRIVPVAAPAIQRVVDVLVWPVAARRCPAISRRFCPIAVWMGDGVKKPCRMSLPAVPSSSKPAVQECPRHHLVRLCGVGASGGCLVHLCRWRGSGFISGQSLEKVSSFHVDFIFPCFTVPTAPSGVY